MKRNGIRMCMHTYTYTHIGTSIHVIIHNTFYYPITLMTMVWYEDVKEHRSNKFTKCVYLNFRWNIHL